MKVKCGWCPVILDPGPPDAPPDALVSHGMCPECFKKMQASMGKYKGVADDHEGVQGGQGRSGEEVANHIDAVVVALAVLTGTGIIIAFIQAIL